MQRHGDIFDPRSAVLIPSIVSEGSAFPISGATVKNLTIGTTQRLLLAVTNNGVSGSVMCYVNNATTPGYEVSTIPLLAAADTAGGPTSGRAMKGGVTVVNRTQALYMGGQVAVLNSSQRVSLPAAPASMTGAQWDTFMDTIVAHPKTRIYNGGDFKKPKTFITHPLDQTDYLHYQGWHGTFTFNEFWQHISVWSGVNPESRPMSTIFMVFEAAPENNSYEFKTRASFYTRWPLASVPGQAHRPVPTATAAQINASRDHAEATAHVPRGEEVALAAAAATAAGGASWLANAMRGVRAGALAAGEMAELAAPLLAVV